MSEEPPYPGMRQLAERLFAETPPQKHQELVAKLTYFVEEAVRKGVAETMDWSKENIMTLGSKFGTLKKRKQREQLDHPSAAVKKLKENNQTKHNDAADAHIESKPDPKRPSVPPANPRAGVTREKNAKTDMVKARLARFNNSHSSTNETPSAGGAGRSPAPYIDTHLTTPVKGTSTALEKPYFRLTGQVNPAVVRPPEILVKSLSTVLHKYLASGSDYAYISDQLQSIRQDLTVQHCEDWMAQKAYEMNVYVALYHDDLGEFNKCLTRVMAMHDTQNCKHSKKVRWEFRAYYAIYMVILKQWSSVSDLLLKAPPQTSFTTEELQEPPSEKFNRYSLELMTTKEKTDQWKMYYRALAIAECVQSGDRFQLEKLAAAAFPLEKKLVQIILDRERIKALHSVFSALQANQQSLSLEDLEKLVGVKDIEKVLAQFEIPVKSGKVACHEALPIAGALKQRIDVMFDIKGQK